MDNPAVTHCDPLLRTFLDATCETEEVAALDDLITKHAAPAIRRVVRHRMGVTLEPDCSGSSHRDYVSAEDVYAQVVARITHRLFLLKQASPAGPISNFESYVRATTENAFVDWLRARGSQPDALTDSVIAVVADARSNVELTVQQRDYVRALWAEVSRLPRPQRVAVLLNLRDANGRGVIALFPLAGVAAIREIARILEMDAREFAGIFNDLPWDDNAIAAMLGCSRQQVINLRMAARKRLHARMKPFR